MIDSDPTDLPYECALRSLEYRSEKPPFTTGTHGHDDTVIKKTDKRLSVNGT
jgi:hypothetical protein